MPEKICVIADDDENTRRFLAMILKVRQLQCLHAENASQALAIVQKIGEQLALVVTDVVMPGDMDGVDLAHSIRHAYPAIPVILISGFVEEAALKSSGFPFIPKPFLPKTIWEEVDRAMGSGGNTTTGPAAAL
jgi:DNA-binding NtrC family response regulator